MVSLSFPPQRLLWKKPEETMDNRLLVNPWTASTEDNLEAGKSSGVIKRSLWGLSQPPQVESFDPSY
jgi:hypothetical protein